MNRNKGTPIDSISASLYASDMGCTEKSALTHITGGGLVYSLVLALVAGCASIDHQSAPQDWPKLKIEVHEVSSEEIARRCSRYTSFPIACAEVYFRTSTCVIWIGPNASKWVRDHEIAHCWGHDHIGDSTLRDAWAEWRGK